MPLNGWLILDKPLDMTSARAVDRVKKLIKPPKIGHAGTLDPLASGVLPLAIGEATKTVAYAMDKQKSYRFTVAWGEQRATGDAEGEVVATSPVRPKEEQIKAIINRFVGRIQQAPPAYSAVKIGGQRAYALARAGVEVQPEPREVEVFSLLLMETQPESASFLVDCGKGTYIRSLAQDIAIALDTVGYVSYLRRTRVGPFSEEHAISLEKLEKMVHKDALTTVMLPVESMLDDIPACEISQRDAQDLRRGMPISFIKIGQHNGQVQAHCNGSLVALCQLTAGVMKPERVFNYGA